MKDRPRDSRRPTSATKHLVPIPFHKAINLAEGSHVPGDPIVGGIAAEDLLEPKDLVFEGPVPKVTHQVRQVGHTAAKSRLLRSAAYRIVAFAIAPAVV